MSSNMRDAVLICIAVGLMVVSAITFNSGVGKVCYEAGRKVGGMEQRIFDAAANGDQPLKSEQDDLAKGPPSDCR